MKQGGTARRAMVQKMVESLGGRLEVFYFAFGEKDVYLIFDVPDNPTAAAISLAVGGTGAIRMRTIVLLTLEEIDQAMKKPVQYEPPRWEVQEVAKDIGRLISEGGKASLQRYPCHQKGHCFHRLAGCSPWPPRFAVYARAIGTASERSR